MNPRSLVRWALLLLAPVLAACYQSTLPLGPPEQGTIDPAFIGAWTCVDPKDAKNVATITTVPFDAHQFYVEWREEPEHVTRYRAYTTRLGAETLWNVEELDAKASSGGFVFLRVRLAADGGLAMTLVQDEALHGLKGEAAIRDIRRRVQDGGQDAALFGPFATCAATAAPASK